jgi:hypothetical protein
MFVVVCLLLPLRGIEGEVGLDSVKWSPVYRLTDVKRIQYDPHVTLQNCLDV